MRPPPRPVLSRVDRKSVAACLLSGYVKVGVVGDFLWGGSGGCRVGGDFRYMRHVALVT